MAKSPSYQPRLYREAMGNKRWISFSSAFRETDLWVAVDKDHFSSETERYTMDRILYYRGVLEKHISDHPEFNDSLVPVVSPGSGHPVTEGMYSASIAAGTGPMSAVAGAMAEFICRDIVKKFNAEEVIVENGGDIFMTITSPVTVAVYAGESPLSEKIGLEVKPGQSPIALCSSSGTVGHSLSFGVADACMIACREGALADAYATAFCNDVKKPDIIDEIAKKALSCPDILSVVIIAGDKMAIGGSLEVKLI